jgi:hypothetical protein
VGKDPWTNAGPHFGHPNKADSVRFASNSWFSSERGALRCSNENSDGGLYGRAMAALSAGDDSRFRRLVSRFSDFDW